MNEEHEKQRRIIALEEWLKERTNLMGKSLINRAEEIYRLEEFKREYEEYGQSWSPAKGVCDPFEEDDDYGGMSPVRNLG